MVLSDSGLLNHLKKLTESSATIYDKAMDSGASPYAGDSNHRLFDHGHGLFDAWEKVKQAAPNDSFKDEVLGYVTGLWKDITTSKGLPFVTLEKESYETWAETVSNMNIPGVDRKYLYDLTSFDAFEVLGTAIGVVGVALALSKKDKEKLSELLGSMGVVSIISANPLMGVFTVSSTAYSYTIKKQKINKKSFIQGSAASSTTAIILSVLGLPFLFELIIAVLVAKLIKKHVFGKKDLLNLISENLKNKTSKINLDYFKGLKFKKSRINKDKETL